MDGILRGSWVRLPWSSAANAKSWKAAILGGVICLAGPTSGCKSPTSGTTPPAADSKGSLFGAKRNAGDATASDVKDYSELSRDFQNHPSVTGKPAPTGPVARFASSIKESAVAKGISSAFHRSDPNAPGDAEDPTSLNTGIRPADAKFFVDLGRLNLEEGNTEGALFQYRKALALEPRDSEAMLGMAHVYDAGHRFEQATEWYVKATQANPRDPTAFNDLGLCYARRGQYAKASESLQGAVLLSPRKKLYRNNLATVLVANNRPVEALRHLEQVHEPHVAHYNLGFLLKDQGRVVEARKQFELAVEKNASFAEARQWAEFLAAEENSPTSQMADSAPTEDDVFDSQVADRATTAVRRAAPNTAPPGAPSRVRQNVARNPADRRAVGPSEAIGPREAVGPRENDPFRAASATRRGAATAPSAGDSPEIGVGPSESSNPVAVANRAVDISGEERQAVSETVSKDNNIEVATPPLPPEIRLPNASPSRASRRPTGRL